LRVHRNQLNGPTADGNLIVITEYFKEEHETWEDFIATMTEMHKGKEWNLCHGGARLTERNKVPVVDQKKKAKK